MRWFLVVCVIALLGSTEAAHAQNFWEKVNARQQFLSFRHGTHGDLYAVNDRSYQSVDDGKSWIVFNPLSGETCIAVDSNENFYCGTATTLMVSKDSGNTWVDLKFRPTRCIEVINGELFAGCDSGLYRSADNGLNWTRVYEGTAVDAIAFSPNHQYFLQTRGYLYRSNDGIDWTKRVYSTSYTIEQIAFSSTHDIYLAILKDQGGNIDHSANDGDTWGDAPTTGFSTWVLTGVQVTSSNAVYALGSIQSDADPSIFVGGFGLHSSDGLANVDLVSSGLPLCACRVLTLTPMGKLLASTDSGIFRSTSSVSAVGRSATLADFSVTNYPNPFATTTTLGYILPQPAKVSVAIYNTLGIRVEELSQQMESAGRHTIEINASALPTGIYACELIAGTQRQVKMVTVAR